MTCKTGGGGAGEPHLSTRWCPPCHLSCCACLGGGTKQLVREPLLCHTLNQQRAKCGWAGP